jgi:ATP-dependent Clp protease adaptor protein ClpS
MRRTAESLEPLARQATSLGEIPSTSPLQDIVDLGLERPPVCLRRGLQSLQDIVVEIANQHIRHKRPPTIDGIILIPVAPAYHSPSRDYSSLVAKERGIGVGRRLSESPLMRYALGVADRQERTDGAVRERVDSRTQDPTLYTVVLLNDDYTTMEFVLQVLEVVFQKSPAEAYQIMMAVHLNGRGIAGVYPWEVAETKADKVGSLASEAGYPLRATVEEA